MSDIKVVIGAEIKELEQKLAVAKAKLISFGQEGPRALAPMQQRLSGLTFPTQRVDKFKDAFKNLATGLIGPTAAMAGIGLVIAGATKWFHIIIKDFITVGDAAEKTAKKIKEYNDLVNSVTTSVAKETEKTIGLIAVLGNESETRERKLSAIKELQKIQPEIFKGLKLEGEAVVGLNEAYEAYIANLSIVIRAKIVQAQIEAKITELLQLQGAANTKNEQAQLDNLKNLINTNEVLKETKKNLQDTKLGKGFLTDKQTTERVNALKESIKGLVGVLSEMSSALKVPEIKVKKLKVKPEEVEIVKPERIPDFNYFNPDTIKRISGAGLKPTLVLKPKVSIEISDAELEQGLKKVEDYFINNPKLEAFQKAATDAIANTISNIASDSISMAADAIGEAIAGNTDALPNLFEGLVKSIGNQVKELGKYLVQLGVQMIVARKAADNLSFNPYTAIAAGAALQILGSTLTAAFNKRANKGFATGVRNLQEGGVYNVGERGPETIYLPRGSSVRPNNEVNAYGGGNMVFIPAVSLRGSDLVIAFNRASQSMSRNG